VTLRSLFFCLIASSLCAQALLPAFDAEALSGRKVTMPGEAQGHPAILVVCFTHASGPHCTEWAKRLNSEFHSDSSVARYTVIFLEDAPKLVRGMAKSGIKSSAEKEDYDRYLIVTEHEKDLKTAVHFEAPDDAYLVVLGPDGAVRGNWHGPVSDDTVRHIRELVR
jgi:hypothetical protein